MKHLRNALLVVAAITSSALADAKKDAKQRAERAAKLYQEGKFADALDELMTSYALDPQPDILYAIAQAHVRLDRCAQAITFYERFLDSKPKPGPAAAARQAIAHCKSKPAPDATELDPGKPIAATEPPPPPVVEPPKPDPVAEPAPPPAPTPAPPIITPSPPAVDDPAPEAAAWYTDPLGGVLVGGGLVGGVVAVVLLRSAYADRDRADDAGITYERHGELVDRAERSRNYAVVTGAAAVVLIGAGITRYLLRDTEHHGVAITPTANGGVVVWHGGF